MNLDREIDLVVPIILTDGYYVSQVSPPINPNWKVKKTAFSDRFRERKELAYCLIRFWERVDTQPLSYLAYISYYHSFEPVNLFELIDYYRYFEAYEVKVSLQFSKRAGVNREFRHAAKINFADSGVEYSGEFRGVGFLDLSIDSSGLGRLRKSENYRFRYIAQDPRPPYDEFNPGGPDFRNRESI